MELKKVVTKLVTDAKVELCVKNLPKNVSKSFYSFSVNEHKAKLFFERKKIEQKKNPKQFTKQI